MTKHGPTGMPLAGIDRVIADAALRRRVFDDSRVGLVTNDVATTAGRERTLDALVRVGVRVAAAFGPEHGLHAAGPRCRGRSPAGSSSSRCRAVTTGPSVMTPAPPG